MAAVKAQAKSDTAPREIDFTLDATLRLCDSALKCTGQAVASHGFGVKL